MPKILCSEKFNSQETPARFIEAGFDVDEMINVDEGQLPLLTQIEKSNPEALFVGLHYQIDKPVLDKAPNLKVVATRTTGLDCLDLEECKKRGIEVLSLRGEDDFMKTIPATAEFTFLNMGMLLRKTGHELKGKQLLIIGFGRIGKQLSKYANSFGMIVRGADKGSEIVLPSALKWADIVSLNITADEENRNFMDKTKFEMMKDGSWFLNSARSWLVDNEALKWALDNKLAGAWSDFPVGFEHPNLVVTNHQGGRTLESLEKTESFMCEKLIKWLSK